MENSSYNGFVAPAGRLFGRQRRIHDVLGGGKVAEVLLWKDKRVSGGTLIGTAAIWFLFEVVEYNLVTLLCHLTITAMLLIFIWSSAADFFNWNPPNIPEMVLEDSSWRDVASTLHRKFNDFLSTLMYVASGYDPKLFLLTIVSLWIISIVGSSISSLNLLFFGIVCFETLPYLYERYEDEVDNLSHEVSRRVKIMYSKFEGEVLGKIPRSPVKNKNN